MGFGALESKTNGHVPGTVLLVQDFSTSDDTAILRHGSGRNKHIVLSPQPSNDPNDPLNWSYFERHVILSIILLGGVIITGCPLLSLNAANMELSLDLHTSYENIAKLAGYILLSAGVAGPIVAALARKYGKRPLYVLCSLVSLVGCILGATATTYKTLVIVRILQGVGMTSYETVLNATIGDLFFVHERGPRIACVMLVLGSFSNIIMIIAGVITTRWGWHANFYVLVPFNALQTILVVLFVPKTAYKRNKLPASSNGSSQDLSQVSTQEMQASKPEDEKEKVVTVDTINAVQTNCTTTSSMSVVPRRRKTFVQRITLWNGVLVRDSLWKMIAACLVIMANLVVAFIIFVSSIIMAWLVATSVLSSLVFTTPPYNLTPAGVGWTSVGSLIGGLGGAIFMMAASDPFVKWMTKRNNGIYEPEFRLVCVLVGALITIGGLSGFGHTVQAKMGIYLVCFFWGMLVFGTMIIMTATTAYALDAFAMYAVEIFMMNMVFKNFFFYGVANFITTWFEIQGPAKMFDICAGVTAVTCAVTIPMYIMGKRYRAYWAKHDLVKICKLETDKSTI